MQPKQDTSSTQQGQAKAKPSRQMHYFTAPAKRIEESLEIMAVLAGVLEHNSAFKSCEPGEHPAMINEYGEDGVVRAMRVIAWAAHREFCQMAIDLEIPE